MEHSPINFFENEVLFKEDMKNNVVVIKDSTYYACFHYANCCIIPFYGSGSFKIYRIHNLKPEINNELLFFEPFFYKIFINYVQECNIYQFNLRDKRITKIYTKFDDKTQFYIEFGEGLYVCSTITGFNISHITHHTQSLLGEYFDENGEELPQYERFVNSLNNTYFIVDLRKVDQPKIVEQNLKYQEALDKCYELNHPEDALDTQEESDDDAEIDMEYRDPISLYGMDIIAKKSDALLSHLINNKKVKIISKFNNINYEEPNCANMFKDHSISMYNKDGDLIFKEVQDNDGNITHLEDHSIELANKKEQLKNNVLSMYGQLGIKEPEIQPKIIKPENKFDQKKFDYQDEKNKEHRILMNQSNYIFMGSDYVTAEITRRLEARGIFNPNPVP